MLYKVVLTSEYVDEIHSYENYWVLLSCGTVYYVGESGPNFRFYGWSPKV